MSTAASTFESARALWPGDIARVAAAAEVLLVFAGTLLYIWRWQYHHPHSWAWLLAAVLLSHALRREGLRDVGLGFSGVRASAEVILPLALAIYLPVFVYALLRGHLVLLLPNAPSLVRFLGYGAWCVAQQYLAQGYFHRRLMRVIRTPHLSSALVALMFGACHIPNPVLMVITTAGGFVMAEVYKRHPSIWPLALAQAVGGTLTAALAPATLVHNMRVGPGYYLRIRR